MRIAITTPTGHIGSALTDRLLASNHDLVLLVRDPGKVRHFTSRGATAIGGDLTDAEYVREATRGVDAMFWLTPPSYGSPDMRAFQQKVGRSAAEAVEANRINRVVHLSSLGAQHAKGTGPIAGLHDVEGMLNEAAENVTHLRPGFFMENHLGSLDGIRQAKSIFFPVPAEAGGVFIATRDIADFAAKRIQDAAWKGRHVIELYGPAEITFGDFAEAISDALGEKVQHVQTSMEQTREALHAMGCSEDVCDRMLQLYEAAAAGLLNPTQTPTPATRGKTTVKQFAREVVAPLVRGETPVA
ncbi:MAG: NmrA family NAD(P)-binding protein [Gemmatimonadetes bacterium]|nr:NmrA family NAD(P)-binding protein [Gemmatimonadota bacterium]